MEKAVVEVLVRVWPRVTGARLETERLHLRWFTLDDIEAYNELGTHPEFIRYVGNEPFASLDAARETMLAAPLKDYATYGYGRFACVWKQTGQVIPGDFDLYAKRLDD
jgi:[ribosomal protein S5]-alanine N-acetyltransferase